MSAATAVTMQDLELEHAELLPGRETLWVFNQSFNKQFALASGNNVLSGNNLAGVNAGGQSAYTTAVGNNISQY